MLSSARGPAQRLLGTCLLGRLVVGWGPGLVVGGGLRVASAGGLVAVGVSARCHWGPGLFRCRWGLPVSCGPGASVVVRRWWWAEGLRRSRWGTHRRWGPVARSRDTFSLGGSLTRRGARSGRGPRRRRVLVAVVSVSPSGKVSPSVRISRPGRCWGPRFPSRSP